MPPPRRSRAAAPRKGAGRSSPDGVRLQRFLADAGVASRRACEQLIEEGRVSVNGELVTSLPVFIKPGVDRILVDGTPIIAPERLVYVMLNKPGRTLSAVVDEPGAARRTVLDLVEHPSGARLFPVGRLDYETRGLVLLTNDGELSNRLIHPRYGVEKTYQAEIRGFLDEESLSQLEKGIYLAERREGRTVGATRASKVSLRMLRADRDRSVIEITLKEGRNRQVRRMLAAVGCPVRKLERVAMGPLKLRGLARGAWRELSRDELRALRSAAEGSPARAPRSTRDDKPAAGLGRVRPRTGGKARPASGTSRAPRQGRRRDG